MASKLTTTVVCGKYAPANYQGEIMTDVQTVTQKGNIKVGQYAVTAQCPANTVAIGGGCDTDMLASGSYNPSGYDQRINGRNYTCVARHDAGSANGNIASELTVTALCGKFQTPVATSK